MKANYIYNDTKMSCQNFGKTFRLVLFVVLLFPYCGAQAQLFDFLAKAANDISDASQYGRGGIRSSIQKMDECKTGVLTFEHGAAVLFGTNGYACTYSVNNGLRSKLKAIYKEGLSIDDVFISENGNYIVVYNNGMSWYGVLAESVLSALRSLPSGTEIKSVTFNDKGEYALTTSRGLKSNNSLYQAFYDDHIGEYGDLMSVNINGDGAVFCYKYGCYYVGKIPKGVETAIKEFSGTPKFVRFNAHGDYLICSDTRACTYLIPDVSSSRTTTMVTYDYAVERAKRKDRETIARMDKEGRYEYVDSTGIHKVYCGLLDADGGIRFLLKAYIGSQRNASPGLTFTFVTLGSGNTTFNEMEKTLSSEGVKNMYVEIVLSDGEVLTSNVDNKLSTDLLGFNFVMNFVGIRSDRKSLSGTESSIKYLVERLSHNNITSIKFKGRYILNMSGCNTKDQLLYDFDRLFKESGHMNLLLK